MNDVDWQFIALLIPMFMGFYMFYLFGEMMGMVKMNDKWERKMMRKVLDGEE